MSIKPNLAEQHAHALAGSSLLAVEGQDAEGFLQAQTMNDVRALAPMHWQWNGWLNAKGRVIALFALLRLRPDAFWLLLPDFPASELLPLLQRYVFRSKLKLRVLDEWQPAAALEPILASDGATSGGHGMPANRIEGSAETGFALDFSGDGGTRHLRLLARDHPGLLPADPGIDQRWRELDLVHGLPRLETSQREAWTPQMLSLDRLGAYSLRKGCYPGQEIVARTHYLGQAKRGLAGIEGQGLCAGMEVSGPEKRLGTMACATADGRLGLAVLPAELDAGLPLHGPVGPLQRRPLASGLGR